MSETTPLLGDEAQRQRAPISGSFLQAKSTRSICFLIALFSFLLSMGGAIANVPTTRLIEDHICRSYYDGQGGPPKEIDETMCKVDEVQSRLVFLNGWLSMIEGTLRTWRRFLIGEMHANLNDRIACRFSLRNVRRSVCKSFRPTCIASSINK